MTHQVTADVRARFPLAYVDADDRSDAPLLRWLSLLWDQVGEVADTGESFAPDDGSRSALIDPDRADDGWLPWLGQLLGFSFPATMPAASMRAALNSFTFQRGTAAAIVSAAQRYLKPGSPVVVDRVDQWHYTVTVFTADIIGLTLRDLDADYATLNDVAAAFPRLSDFETQQGNLQAAVEAEKPAGLVMTLIVTTGSLDELAAAYATLAAVDAAFPTMGDLAVWAP